MDDTDNVPSAEHTASARGPASTPQWLRELVEEPQHEYPHFVAALSLIGVLPPSEVVELLGRRLRRLAEHRG